MGGPQTLKRAKDRTDRLRNKSIEVYVGVAFELGGFCVSEREVEQN